VVSQENVGLNKLAALIRADASMSVGVLRLANSPLFGTRREITGILHALAMLGLSRVRSIVMTVAVRDFLAPASKSTLFAPCWRHSLACAFIAEEHAETSPFDRDTAYTAGLLHQLGRLALIAGEPKSYERMARAEFPEDLEAREREWFGADSREVGLALVDEWRLPAAFRPTVAAPGAVPDPEGLGALIHACCALADYIGFHVLPSGAPRGEMPALPDGGAVDPDALVTAVATKINTLECNLVMV
jgi:HD-like signal output (HDOD) protein